MVEEAHREHRGGQTDGVSSRFDRLTVVLFLIALWLPLFATVVAPESAVSPTEKRFLARRPSLPASLEELARWPAALEAYFDDQLGFRDWLISRYAWLQIEIFGSSPSRKLVVGKQGWFFFGDDDAIAQYRGVAPLSDAQLSDWQAALEERRDWLAERGIAFLFVLVPDKHLMYSQFMPDRLPRTGADHPVDQLARHLARHSDVPVLDLRDALAGASRRQRTYHRTDSHWNDFGAYVGYSAIIERLREISPKMTDAAPAPARLQVSTQPGMGLAAIVGLGDTYPEEAIGMELIRPRGRIKPEHRADYARRVESLRPIAHGVDDRTLPRAVVFRDSFGNALVPYLAENFSRVLFVWSRDIDPRIVGIEQPDVVIQEVVGRFLGRRPRTLSELTGSDEDAAAPQAR